MQIAIISLEKWSVTALATSNIQGVGLQPTHNTQPANFLFFFIFLLMSVFFILQVWPRVPKNSSSCSSALVRVY